MLRRLLERVAATLLPQPRVIYDLDGTTPYLTRYYLLGRPSMPDGSAPFDKRGHERPGVRWPDGWGIYLHRFHRDDKDRDLHNHPWRWAFSILLAGGYREERRSGNDIVTRVLRPPALNWIGQHDFHRVDLLDGEAWTLFVAGPKVSGWGFWEPQTGEVVPWRIYVARPRAREAS
jgi:hypothetical protein